MTIRQKWPCSVVDCHQVSNENVNTIMLLKHIFQKHLAETHENLKYINESCPHGHYLKAKENKLLLMNVYR